MDRNNHYVPQFILRQYGDHLCVFNTKTQSFEEGRNPRSIYSEKGLYPDDIEEGFHTQVETPFANLLYQVILPAEDKITLDHSQLNLIKKFLLVSVLRAKDVVTYIPSERHFYDQLKAKIIELEGPDADLEQARPPFAEKDTENLSDSDYWLRTLRCIINAPDIFPAHLAQRADVTYAAYRWATVIVDGFLGFWDASPYQDEFVISDIGMTSENEVGSNGVTVFNEKKLNFLMDCYQRDSHLDPSVNQILESQIIGQTYFHENFMMFPLSAQRMIVSINPFFRFMNEVKNSNSRLHFPSLNEFTKIPDPRLFVPNTVSYAHPRYTPGPIAYDPADRYCYTPVRLSGYQTRYCNALFMDRIEEFLGFSSLEKVKRSIKLYYELNKNYCPRVDYSGLYKVLDLK